MKDPYEVYHRMKLAIGVSFNDQYIPENPLTMGDHGYEGGGGKTATTGGPVVIDGLVIDSPEAVVEHLERFAWPQWQK